MESFLEDLEEATKGDNAYFFGNVLLEEITGSKTSDIIDGQQRITTIIIFARALCKVLNDKAKNGEKLSETMKNIDEASENIENEEFIERIEQDYLLFRSKARLQVVEYDRDYFKDVIIYNDDKKHSPQTPSQQRIKEAKDFFIKSLSKKDTKDILKIFEALQNAEILSIPFANKKDSVLMFELQNNRGKQLTNMEKLKSYLAYQIYTYSDKEKAEERLNEMTKVFEEIYRLINDIKTDEDSILNYFNIFYCGFGFRYRENNNDVNYKRILKETKIEDKISWIDSYVKELKNAFVNFKDFEKSNNIYREYLSRLKVTDVYPFILKACRLFGNNSEKLEEVFKSLEVIAFRHRLTKTGADLSSRLNDVLKNFDSIESLAKGLQEVCSNKVWYWGNDNIINSLSQAYHKNDDGKKVHIIDYLLMRYENHLRGENTNTKSYAFTLKDIAEPQIEHIAPQTENGEKISSGYCEYDKDFYDNHYLHCIGNLMLAGGPHNKALGNKPFQEKLASYEKSPMAQHREIKDFVDNNKWDKEAINNRHEKIKEFVLKTWSF